MKCLMPLVLVTPVSALCLYLSFPAWSLVCILQLQQSTLPREMERVGTTGKKQLFSFHLFVYFNRCIAHCAVSFVLWVSALL